MAANLWSKVMSRIHNTLEVKEFESPSDIEFKTINLSTGQETNLDLNGENINTELRKEYDKAGFIKKEEE